MRRAWQLPLPSRYIDWRSQRCGRRHRNRERDRRAQRLRTRAAQMLKGRPVRTCHLRERVRLDAAIRMRAMWSWVFRVRHRDRSLHMKRAWLTVPGAIGALWFISWVRRDERCEGIAVYISAQAAASSLDAGRLAVSQNEPRCKGVASFREAVAALDSADAVNKQMAAEAAASAAERQRLANEAAKNRAFAAAELLVGDQLVSPGSARYGNERLRALGGGIYFVTGWVDSQNRFGALLRSNWEVGFALQPDGRAIILTPVSLSD